MEAERPLGQMGGESPLEDVPATSVKVFTELLQSPISWSVGSDTIHLS